MVSLDYRLAPATTHPGQLFDVRRAVRWLRANGADHGIDPARIGLWGSSAGGHLAALAGVHSEVACLPGEEVSSVSSAVAAVVDGYGPADLPSMIDLAGERAPGESVAPEVDLLGGPIRDNLDAAVSASPALQVNGATPPFLLMHGLADTLVRHDQSMALYTALAAHGNDVILYLIEGFGHGFFNPGDVFELGPGLRLDQGRLEREPSALARIYASTPAGAAFAEWHPHASFPAIADFFARTLKGRQRS